jgi:transporter family protein
VTHGSIPPVGKKGQTVMASWILPTLGYMVLLGAAGVTSKLALRTITWEQLVLWVPLAYIVFSVALVAKGTKFPLGVGGAWAAATAFCAAASLILLFFALTKGDASQIVPAGSAYPVVTLIGSALFLGESITTSRIIGTALVVVGVIVISR